MISDSVTPERAGEGRPVHHRSINHANRLDVLWGFARACTIVPGSFVLDAGNQGDLTMRNHRSCRLLFWTLLVLLPGLARADVYVAIDGVLGDSTEANHRQWISARSAAWNVEQGAAPQPVVLVMHDGPWSAKLLEKLVIGKAFPRVIIDTTMYIANTWVVFSRLTLTDASVRRFTSSVAESTRAVSQVELFYTGLQWEYWTYSPAGAATGSIKGSLSTK